MSRKEGESMKRGEFFMVVSPGEMGKSRRGREVQMVYRLGSGFRLLQAGGEIGTRRGQIMGIDTGAEMPLGSEEGVVRQVMGQLREHGYEGLCLLFPPRAYGGLASLVGRLSQACEREGYLCMVREEYGEIGRYSRVMVSTALSGGDLEGRFRQAMEKYGGHRVMMEIDCMGEDFLIPCPQGVGEKKSLEEIRALAEGRGAQVFFSKELCGRYFTYENGEHSLRFVLYDDEGTVGEKIRLARLWKLAGIVGVYGELESRDLL